MSQTYGCPGDPATALTIAMIIAYQAQKLARKAVSAIRSS